MTRGPAGRVAAILELVRPVADEIVVAVDERAEPDVVATLAQAADRLIGYPYAEPVDRPLPWLHRQCSGTWLLTVDDDELPSRSLLDALPRLVAARNVTHYWLPRRWLYPGADSYLDEPPWRPDYQLRLVLNDLRLLRFPDETHWPIAALGPAGYLDLPLYHADLVLNSIEARVRKAERYERLLPGKRVAGRPLNVAFYLPERLGRPATAAVPAADLELIRGVLEATPRPAGRAAPLPVATREDVDRHWAGRHLGDGAYSARLELREQPRPLVSGEVRTLDVSVENLGDAVWPWGREQTPEIRLTYRWWSGSSLAAEGLRTPLPRDVEPGDGCLVPLAVQAPSEPGRYRLAVDLVHEHVRWFGSGFEVEIDVLPRRRLAVVGPVELDRLPELEPALEPLVLTAEPELLRKRYAGDVAPSAAVYLLAGLPAGRTPAAVLLGLRTARLVLGAGRLRRGGVPGYAREFLEALGKAEAVLVVSDGTLRRERWVERATVLAARMLGLRVILR